MDTIQKLIESVTDKQLRSFTAEYARYDDAFARALAVRFADTEFDDEVRKIAQVTAQALDGADEYRNRGSWGHIQFDLSSVYYEIRQRIKRKQFRLAFAQSAAAYTELLKVFDYQKECEISDEAEFFIDEMSEISGKVKALSDQEYIFDCCIKLAGDNTGSDFGADYQDRFMQIAAKFVTQENRKDFDDAVEQHYVSWKSGAYAQIKLSVVQRLDGASAAAAFMREHLQFDEIRKSAYDSAMRSKDYDLAAQLCTDAPVSNHWKAPKWNLLLYDAYKAAGDIQSMINQAENILLSGDLDYYERLKSLHQKRGDWDAVYPQLLIKCKTSLSGYTYMKILSMENELTLLLEQAQSSLDSIFTCGAQLAAQYPDEVQALFVSAIRKEAASAENRTDYSGVCHKISVFHEANFSEQAFSLINELKKQYARRPAFVDELQKIHADLNADQCER
jgi:hypothetical protein